jgi:predicted dehydrogenase
VRILVVGAGLIGRRHLELVAASEQCELAGVVEPAAAARAALPDLDAPVFGSLSDALGAVAGPGLGAIIATPNRFHRDHALACLGAGLPTLVEKPLADTLEDAQAMVAAAAASGVPLLVGHHRRHSSYVTVARDLIRAGTLGRVVAVTASILFYKPDGYFDSAPWRAGTGGGPILINLIHEVDLLRALCGEVESVHAMSSSVVRRFPVEDTAVVTMRFESGALATIALSDTAVCSRSWEHTARENPDYPHAPDTDCYVIAGTEGSLSIPTMRLETYRTAKSWWEPLQTTFLAPARQDPLARQLANLCNVVNGSERPLVSGRDGLESLRVTLAIAEAARTGSTVRPRELPTALAPGGR